MELSFETAELCGIILGDGHLHNTENRITITGSLDDIVYYKNHVILLFQKNFKITPSLVKVKKKNSYRLVVQNKKIFEFFINRFDLVRGKKIDIDVPSIILNNVGY